MDYEVITILLWSLILSPILFIIIVLKPKKNSLNLPPGPPGWPLFGNIFHLGTLPFRTMANLKDIYGPVIWLRIGSINTMVIQSPEAAAELFKNHDLCFSDRLIVETITSHDYHKSSMIFSPYGPYFRFLKRLVSSQMFANFKINETLSIRQKCIDDMLSWIEKEAAKTTEMKENRGIEIVDFIFFALFNVLGNMMLSRDLVEPDSKIGAEFLAALKGYFRWMSQPNVSDLYGFLKPFDLQGLKKNMDRDLGKSLEIVSGFVNERLEETLKQQNGENRRKDFLDVLHEFKGRGGDEPEKLSAHNISVLILEVFWSGGETIAFTIEWALTELLRNPEKMKHVKDEIVKVVGQKKRIEESDIDNLPFLQAIVKETLRLHPPGALIPRKAAKDTRFLGYDVPKNTQVLINAWAIGRDPGSWNEPLAFNPERFLGSKIDYRAQHFEFIPFGGGRRMCAGFSFAHRMLPIILGSLLHKFDWELDDYTTSNTLDMQEKMGFVVCKLVPLKAIPTVRIN